jgi:hypothetical protein
MSPIDQETTVARFYFYVVKAFYLFKDIANDAEMQAVCCSYPPAVTKQAGDLLSEGHGWKAAL